MESPRSTRWEASTAGLAAVLVDGSKLVVEASSDDAGNGSTEPGENAQLSMSENPEEHESEASRPAPRSGRRRKVLAVTAGALGVLLIALVAVMFYIGSGGLDRNIANRVKVALAQYGVRAEFDNFRLSLGPRT